MKKICSIDTIHKNQIELPKAAKCSKMIQNVKFEVNDAEARFADREVNVHANLNIITTYKAVDHTLRWNEQNMPISLSKSLSKINMNKMLVCKARVVKKLSENLTFPNIFIQEFYVKFDVYSLKNYNIKAIKRETAEAVDEGLKTDSSE